MIATVRNPAAAIEALAAKYRGQPIDVIINNAGTLGDVPKQKIGGLDQSDPGDDRGDECSELRHFACLQKFHRCPSDGYYD